MTRDAGAVGLSIKRLQHRNHRAVDAALAPLGTSLAQWDLLRHLHRNPGASLHDLAVLTFQSDQAAGTLVGRMVERGLLRAEPGPGRARRHAITEHGEQVRVQAQSRVDEVVAVTFAPLDDAELAELGSWLDRLLG